MVKAEILYEDDEKINILLNKRFMLWLDLLADAGQLSRVYLQITCLFEP